MGQLWGGDLRGRSSKPACELEPRAAVTVIGCSKAGVDGTVSS